MDKKMIEEIYNKIDYNTTKKIELVALTVPIAIPLLNVLGLTLGLDIYKPPIDLIRSSISLLNLTYAGFSILTKPEQYTKDVKEIQIIYNEVLKEYIKLNKTLELEHPIEVYTLYSRALYEGYLSKDKQLIFGTDKVKDVEGIWPSNIICGQAVCRHIAVMLKDIYNAYGIQSEAISVNSRYYTIEDINKTTELLNTILEKAIENHLNISDELYNHEEEINKYYTFSKVKKNASNHKITIANYNGNTYYLDPTNTKLYIPSKYEKDSLVDPNGLREIKVVQTSKNKKILPQYSYPTISFSESTKYIRNTIQKYTENEYLLEAFYRENKEAYEEINNIFNNMKYKSRTKKKTNQ